jgi:nucleoid-associated protein YgaU
MPSSSQFDCNAPRDRVVVTPASSNRRRVRGIVLSVALLAGAATFATTVIAPRASAQDLGEIARQERAKKQNNPAPPATHVYTNEDLKRQEILTPEDKSRFSATNQPAPVKPAQSSTQPASESTPGNADLPIGARPPLLKVATAPDTTSPTTRNSICQSRLQTSKQSPAQPNTSPGPARPAKTNATPISRASVSVTSATSAKSIPARPVNPVSLAFPIAPAQPTGAPIPTPIPLDQMPLGDVARYYRAKNLEQAEATAKPSPDIRAASSIAIPGCVPCATPSTEPSVATTLRAPIPAPVATETPTATELDQMPLGDVARYYRAKKLQDDAVTKTLSVSSPATPAPLTSPYPMTVLAAPLASLKSLPSRGAELRVLKSRVLDSRVPVSRHSASRLCMSSSPPRTSHSLRIAPNVPNRHASINRLPVGRPSTLRPLAAPTRSVAGQASSVRVARGDTLWQLARRYLGSGTRWTELAALNPTIQDPRRLRIGAQLVLHPRT